MRRNLVIVVLALAACRSAAAQNAAPSSTAFHWLDAVKNAALFERIKASFADELKPDGGFDDLAVRCVAIGEQGIKSRGHNDRLQGTKWPAASHRSQGPEAISYYPGKTLRQCQKITIVSSKIG
jgi:hypothetical protein